MNEAKNKNLFIRVSEKEKTIYRETCFSLLPQPLDNAVVGFGLVNKNRNQITYNGNNSKRYGNL